MRIISTLARTLYRYFDVQCLVGCPGGALDFQMVGVCRWGLKTGPCLKPLGARKIYTPYKRCSYAYPVLILHTSDIYPVLLLLTVTVKEMKNSTHILRESVLLIELTVTQLNKYDN